MKHTILKVWVPKLTKVKFEGDWIFQLWRCGITCKRPFLKHFSRRVDYL